MKFSSNHKGSWLDATHECKKQGQDLAMPKSPEELRTLMTAMKTGNKGRCAYIGLQTKMLYIHSGRTDLRYIYCKIYVTTAYF